MSPITRHHIWIGPGWENAGLGMCESALTGQIEEGDGIPGNSFAVVTSGPLLRVVPAISR